MLFLVDIRASIVYPTDATENVSYSIPGIIELRTPRRTPIDNGCYREESFSLNDVLHQARCTENYKLETLIRHINLQVYARIAPFLKKTLVEPSKLRRANHQTVQGVNTFEYVHNERATKTRLRSKLSLHITLLSPSVPRVKVLKPEPLAQTNSLQYIS